jgi:secreted trypsin-like serine protease
LTSVGFGGISVEDIPEILQKVILSYVPNDVCSESEDPILDESYEDKITESIPCAFSLGRDTCNGDEGGPLIKRGESHEDDIQVGIISW